MREHSPLVSYSPIPKECIKEEPTSEDDGDECQLIAYPPLSPGVIKEESDLQEDSSTPEEQYQVIGFVSMVGYKYECSSDSVF